MSDSVLVPALEVPPTPTTPTSPGASTKPKKANPLTDLIDTEKAYVEHLTGIIRKIAAAWSRSNLPPPELDTMFRSIEGVYKANRGLHNKLKDIGVNPSNPKALGDLLMSWIKDLKAPYEAYCTKFSSGFDTWVPVQSNPKLPAIIQAFSAVSPPPGGPDAPQVWSLDALFLLPKARLKYYRKLYSRLLKNSNPGRSDHVLLTEAIETLDHLLQTVESRASFSVSGSMQQNAPEDEVVIDMRTRSLSPPAPSLPPLRLGEPVTSEPGSGNSSVRGSVTSGERLSRETANTSISRASNATLSMPISTLERRLSTARTLDIFTMNPKVVKLQMSPPSLTFTREMRVSADVVIRFMPRAANQEVIHPQGHIFLLSDLFLVCERMSLEDQNQPVNEGADMWLCYPPLAGKVLRVSEVEGQDNALQVAIMRKETLILETDSIQSRDHLVAAFRECIEFSGSLPPPSKGAPPPLPPIPRFGGPNDGPLPEGNPPPEYQDNFNGRPPSDPGSVRSSFSSQPFMNSPGPGFDGPRSTSFNAQVMNRGPPPMGHPPQMQGPPHLQGPPPHFQGPPPHMQGPPQHQMQPPFPMHPGNGRPGLPPGPGPMGRPPPGPGFPPGGPGFPPGMMHHNIPPRPPSEPSLGMHKSPSARSLASQFSQQGPAPPLPQFRGAFGIHGNHSQPSLHAPQARTLLPSAQPASRAVSMVEPSFDEPSPPNSPVPEMPQHTGPVTSVISAQMKCKVFLQQQHAQWKSLGSAKLKLYRQDPTNIKQLVVEADNKDKTILISTIVLTDGVERVGKTGVAIELSSNGQRTGIVYMIQLRNEESAGGLFGSLLAGSDRHGVRY
ncbi:hypothetical protein FA15DRAFT_662501 [Coprinopsis marcescibilis]|uniref:DH domain-containing protein n=1 Tax=Coprinopsis marcescibilis TaxID=230819 RepID=A0A5C3LCK7_COPMA|nr:hypothetical protein FA15DRAFT_662501 [Coprinopsis marcescibilis]